MKHALTILIASVRSQRLQAAKSGSLYDNAQGNPMVRLEADDLQRIAGGSGEDPGPKGTWSVSPVAKPTI